MRSNTERLTISLPADLAGALREAVATGEFASASEVIREALRQWKHFRPTSRLSPLAPAVEQMCEGLAAVCQRHGVVELWAFGNSLRATHRAGHPLQFSIVLGEPDVSRTQFGRWAMLQVELELLAPARYFLQLVELDRDAAGTVMHDINGPRQRLYTASP